MYSQVRQSFLYSSAIFTLLSSIFFFLFLSLTFFFFFFFFFQAEDGIRDVAVTGVQTCALPIWPQRRAFRPPAFRRSAAGPPARPARSDHSPAGRLLQRGRRDHRHQPADAPGAIDAPEEEMIGWGIPDAGAADAAAGLHPGSREVALLAGIDPERADLPVGAWTRRQERAVGIRIQEDAPARHRRLPHLHSGRVPEEEAGALPGAVGQSIIVAGDYGPDLLLVQPGAVGRAVL